MSFQSRIENFWYSNNFWRFLFLPFSWVVQLLVMLKYFLYQTKLFKSYHSNTPVIVVGNITIGGTGKTPFITYITKKLLDKNIRVGIVSRGYLSQAKNYPHIVTEQDDVATLGDETFMQYHHLKVPMAIGTNRAKVVKALTDKYPLDLIISDDGLQHYAMARDFEIVMVDAKRQFGNQLMLPFGPLREPVSRLKSVNYIVYNGDSSDSFNRQSDLYNRQSKTTMSSMQIKVKGLIHLKSGEQISLNNLNNGNVCAVAAIGNPARFFSSLSNYKSSFEKVIFPDHHAFTLRDFEQINCDTLVMTEKDAVKCQKFSQDHWYYLKVEASLEELVFQELYHKIESIVLENRVLLGENHG